MRQERQVECGEAIPKASMRNRLTPRGTARVRLRFKGDGSLEEERRRCLAKGKDKARGKVKAKARTQATQALPLPRAWVNDLPAIYSSRLGSGEDRNRLYRSFNFSNRGEGQPFQWLGEEVTWTYLERFNQVVLF